MKNSEIDTNMNKNRRDKVSEAF